MKAVTASDHLFDEQTPEQLSHFFNIYPQRKPILDVGFGDPHTSLSIARLGYPIIRVFSSSLLLDQFFEKGARHGIPVQGFVADVFFTDFSEFTFEIVLINGLVHSAGRIHEPESNLLHQLQTQLPVGGLMCFVTVGGKAALEHWFDQSPSWQQMYQALLLDEKGTLSGEALLVFTKLTAQ